MPSGSSGSPMARIRVFKGSRLSTKQSRASPASPSSSSIGIWTPLLGRKCLHSKNRKAREKSNFLSCKKKESNGSLKDAASMIGVLDPLQTCEHCGLLEAG